MAFNPKIIPATDFQPNVGVGLNLPFSSPQVFQSNYTSQDTIKANIINYSLTEPGERCDNPNFGLGLRSFIFEQISNNTLDGIEENISEKIREQFPTIILKAIEVLGIEDENIIRVIIKYSIPQQGVSDEIEINFG